MNSKLLKLLSPSISTMRSNLFARPTLYQIQAREFSFFSFWKDKKQKEKSPDKNDVQKDNIVEETSTEIMRDPSKYLKKQKSGEEKVDVKQQIRELDRSGSNNLFGKYQRQRKTVQERNQNLEEHLHPDVLKYSNVSIDKYQNNTFKRGLGPDEKPFPVSPKLGPFVVDQPLFGAKNYYWCSCGMSKDQPFCDSSHKGSLFKPIKFSLEEQSKEIHLCGCKLTTSAPFCDGMTCKKILAGDKFNQAERLLEENENLKAAQQIDATLSQHASEQHSSNEIPK